MGIISLNQLDKIFDNVKKEIKDYEERTKSGEIFIPKELLNNKKINVKEKIYLSIYYGQRKDINRTDDIISKILSKNQIKKTKNRLCEIGILKRKRINVYEARQKTVELSNVGNECEWCGNRCYILHKHHFPISEKDGGTRTVNICPNCHYTFHKLIGENYE